MTSFETTVSKIKGALDHNAPVDEFNSLMLSDMAMSLALIADRLEGGESATSSGDEKGTGRWVEVDDYAICGECGAVHHGADRNYCPNCGRKMKTGDPEGGAQAWRVIDKEPPVPVSWIEKEIEFLKSQDNEFAGLAASNISGMLNKWRDEQNGVRLKEGG